MSDIINAFQEFDNDLIKGIDNKIEPVILLEDVEVGSLRTILLNMIKGVPDEALKDGDWKKALGHYLIRAKYIVINRLEGIEEIKDPNLIEEIQYEIVEEAKKTDIKLLPSYPLLSKSKILKNIDSINRSLNVLDKSGDKAFISTPNGNAYFNLGLNFTAEHIEELLTKETIESEAELILKVKKPDYLGNSMWDLKHNGRLIYAKVKHEEWLQKFQNREIDIRPGDSLRARTKIIYKYGFDNEVVGISYEIEEVLNVLKLPSLGQFPIDFE